MSKLTSLVKDRDQFKVFGSDCTLIQSVCVFSFIAYIKTIYKN